jgi:hypothetical protein
MDVQQNQLRLAMTSDREVERVVLPVRVAPDPHLPYQQIWQ